MANKDKVIERYPDARAERYKSGKIKYMQRTYYLIWDTFKRNRRRLGEGETEAQAWKDAWENIYCREQETKNEQTI